MTQKTNTQTEQIKEQLQSMYIVVRSAYTNDEISFTSYEQLNQILMNFEGTLQEIYYIEQGEVE